IPAPGPLLAVPRAGAEARRLAARTALASSAGAQVPSRGTRCGRTPGAPRSARRSSLAASTVRANQGWITSRHAWGSVPSYGRRDRGRPSPGVMSPEPENGLNFRYRPWARRVPPRLKRQAVRPGPRYLSSGEGRRDREALVRLVFELRRRTSGSGSAEKCVAGWRGGQGLIGRVT